MIRQLRIILVTLATAFFLTGAHAAEAGTGPFRDPYTGMEFAPVPGGCFIAGATDGNSDERPPHEVCLSPFYLGRYEVTQGQWRRVMGSNPSLFAACGDDCPVDQVSWSDAQEFIARLNRLTGRGYRLPTEAEWEYACRGGGGPKRYCGDDIDAIAWYDRTSGNRVHPVGKKHPNGFGLYDMSGNVWEWVQDWNGRYQPRKQQDPTGPGTGSSRVRRGGSWQYGADKARATWRSSGYQEDRAMDIGFRVAHPAQSPTAR